ncbi:MAG TPA: glycosyltransferase, partial [Tepidisphaeraceae bacterium]
LAHYRRGNLDVVAPSDYQSKPFRIMFAGRLEREKGVFDLIEIAQLLQQDMPDGFEIEICGIGPAKESLINEIQSRGLTSRIKMSGQLDREQMKEAYGRSHVVIVPTKTGSFVEGLNKVVVESVLAGRPAVTSRLSNALEVVNNAAIEVPPDDVKAYAAALKQLASDHELYERARSGCYEAAQHFYDPHKSWGTILRTIILPLLKPFATYKSDCDAQRKNNSPLQDQIS